MPVEVEVRAASASRRSSARSAGRRGGDDGAAADGVDEDVDAAVVVHGATNRASTAAASSASHERARLPPAAASARRQPVERALVDVHATTVPPSRAMMSAVARPMPLAAAVISATLSLKAHGLLLRQVVVLLRRLCGLGRRSQLRRLLVGAGSGVPRSRKQFRRDHGKQHHCREIPRCGRRPAERPVRRRRPGQDQGTARTSIRSTRRCSTGRSLSRSA